MQEASVWAPGGRARAGEVPARASFIVHPPPPGNNPPVPAQAERYEVSDDGLTYTFYLRKGLVWSDGVPITAEDFRYSWLRGLAPETGSKNAQQLWQYILGAKAFNQGKSKAERDEAIHLARKARER